jgi:threonine/homoserine/homoserine lactone efflux protein
MTLYQSPTFDAYLLASFILAITPGPGVIYVLTRTLDQGRGAGLASVCGLAAGNLGNASIASLGLAAVFAASAAAFVVVKFAGAGYLVYLGVQTLRARPEAAAAIGIATTAEAAAPDRPKRKSGRLFRDGALVALLNPKTALFFAALLPQFIPAAPVAAAHSAAAHSAAAPLVQTLSLGCIFVVIALATDTCYVMAAAALAAGIHRRSRWRTWGRYISAATCIGLGLYAAFASPRAAK